MSFSVFHLPAIYLLARILAFPLCASLRPFAAQPFLKFVAPKKYLKLSLEFFSDGMTVLFGQLE